MHDNQTLELQLSETTLYELKRKLFRTWLYADIDLITEDEGIPPSSPQILRCVTSGLRAISIMDARDHNRDHIWSIVRQYLSHLLETGWTLQCGDGQGVLCVRIVDPLFTDQGGVMIVCVPHEGRRQLRALEAWSDAFDYTD